MSPISLSLLVLKTRQVDALRAFYNTLGVQLVEEQHGKGPVHYAGILGPTVLEIYPLPDNVSTADTTTRLGFAVANLREVVDALKAFGTAIVAEPKTTAWGYRAVVIDPDGRSVELLQQ